MNTKSKVIKRYQNRKLYDTTRSCYVTLDDLAEMIRQGEDVVVLDNKTQKDITSNTLTQIIFETERKSNKVLPIHLLQDIIKGSGGSISSFFQNTIKGGIQKTVEKTVKTSAKEFAHVKDEIQRKIGNVTGMSHLHKEIDRLEKKVEDLQKKLKEYQE